MIPFWKKTGKHSKAQSAQKRRQNAKPAVPRTAQQSIPMQRMFEDGTCRVKPNYYTRTIQYQDINYQLAQQEDKTAITISKVLLMSHTETAVLKIQRMMRAGSNCAMLLCWVIISINS